MDRIERLKQQKHEIEKKITLATEAARLSSKKADDRVKVLVGAMFLDQIKRQGGKGAEQLLGMMEKFLARPYERRAVLGEDGKGSEAFHRLTGGEQ